MSLSLYRTLFGGVLLAASPLVFAHAHLLNQIPAENGMVSQSPEAITLYFSEGVESAFSRINLYDHHDKVVHTQKAVRAVKDKKQLIATLKQPLSEGEYRVEWHVVSIDGHKTKGSYRFTVK